MRWGLIGVRIGMILVNLAIAAIIVLSVLPLVSGGLRIDLPDEDLARPTYENNIVTFSIPVDIYNGGYFDITDYRVHFRVTDGDYLVADHTSAPVNIITGRTNHVNIDLELDLSTVPTAELEKLVFERTTLDLEVGMAAGYTMGLTRGDVRINQSMEWEPLIRDFAVDAQGVQLQPDGTNVDLLAPYSVIAADMVTGNAVDLHAPLRNSTSLLGSVSHTITLQSDNQGQLSFTIGQQAALWLMSHPEDLTIGTDLTFQGASFQQDYPYHWGGMT
jgi:hypothetical protein